MYRAQQLRKRFSPRRLFGAGGAGFTDDPRLLSNIFTTFNGSTNITAVDDLVGRIEPIAGGVNLIQSTSASRVAYAGFPFGGVKQLFNYPQAIENAAWTKTNCTALDGQTSWDGTATASRLTVGAAANSGVGQTTISGTQTAIVSGIFKMGTARWLRLFNTAAANASAWFDLQSGVLGTVQASANAGMTDMGNGWWRCWNYGTGSVSPGIRIEDTDGASGSPTAGQTLFVAEPIVATGTTVPTFQNRLGPSNITQTGLSTVNAYYADGVDDFLFVDAASWGTASAGCMADTGNNWAIGAMYCGHDDAGVLFSQCGAVDALKMLEVSLVAGVPQIRIRGTNTAASSAINNGNPHLVLLSCSNGVVTAYLDGVSSTPTVGVAIAETEKLAWMARTPSAPAGHLMGRCDPFLIDRALSAAEAAQLWQYTKNYWGAV